MTQTDEPMTYDERMYPQDIPSATAAVREKLRESLDALYAYRAEDEVEALRVYFWLQNQAELRVRMGISRQLAVGKSWAEIAEILGMDESEATQRWGWIGVAP
ncbi:hypothetical protein [Streptomyces griseofuscus]|uniref:hypothetical protein n=1 Tax=Streptomyces griseofuscus TaxID=146922 RepID=UPI003689C898